MDFRDKMAVITGGATGIGLGLGKALYAAGAHVVLADIEAEKAKRAATTLGERAMGAGLDVRETASFEALAEQVWQRHGRVDVFVNNAGVGAGNKPLLEMDDVDMEWLIEVNFKGVYRGLKVFGPRLVAQSSASLICNVASENALGYVAPGLAVYAGTKHGVLGMSDVMRHELPAHVKLCVAFPGLVHSEMANARRNGPGGALSPEAVAFADAFMAEGMPADEAGRLIAEGMAREDFLIPLHPHVLKLAQTRWEAIQAAYDAHAPYTPESEAMNVLRIAERMAAKAKQKD